MNRLPVEPLPARTWIARTAGLLLPLLAACATGSDDGPTGAAPAQDPTAAPITSPIEGDRTAATESPTAVANEARNTPADGTGVDGTGHAGADHDGAGPDGGRPDSTVPDSTTMLPTRAPMAVSAGRATPVIASALVPRTPQGPLSGPPSHEELLVFVQRGASPAQDRFIDRQLPQLQAAVTELGLPLRVIDVADGAPAEVTITPLVVYQDHRGRSVFQARTTSLDRLATFVRTARRARPAGFPEIRRDRALVFDDGRARIALAIKVSPVTGTPPDHDAEAFADEALTAIATALQERHPTTRVSPLRPDQPAVLAASDRTFYLDAYPWAADDGTLYVSSALFSQFHCKLPIFRSPSDGALTGPWSERSRLLADVARLLDDEVARQQGLIGSGDAFDTLAADIPVRGWDALGLSLPPAPPAGRDGFDIADELDVEAWEFATGDEPLVDGEPAAQLVFRFAPPLHSNAGEVTGASGALSLGRTAEGRPSAHGATGWVEVDVSSVSMGLDDLDQLLQTASFLDGTRFPTARFDLDELRAEPLPLDFGRPATAVASGRFSMVGVSVPLELRVLLDPVLDAAGDALLIASGSFELRLAEPFDISGPDGPSPAKDTLQFDFQFALRPAGS